MVHKYSEKQKDGEETGEEWRGKKIRWGKCLHFCFLEAQLCAVYVYVRRVAVEVCFPPKPNAHFNQKCDAIRSEHRVA